MDMTDEQIFCKVEELLQRLDQNQRIQKLATDNGIDVKNSVKLTDDTVDTIAVSVVALLLAKREDDPRYKQLVRYGTQRRSLKTEIINSYKNQANQLIERCRNRITEEGYYHESEEKKLKKLPKKMTDLELFVAKQIKKLIPDCEAFELNATVGSSSFSVELFATVGGKKMQCQDMIDEGMFSEKDFNAASKAIAEYCRDLPDFDENTINKYSVKLSL